MRPAAALDHAGADAAGRTVRVTLTGPGGGTWLVPLDIGRAAGEAEDDRAPAEAGIVTDVVAFCFLLGGRGDPGSLPAELDGDRGLARTVLRTAPALSGP